ncbi:hypothetical protein Q5R05_05265 [Leuconostoc carnosum]|uniref:hypothetical protein n=1 Tax=Leuconostoc carnosum TaxID=1252 RepID=UPI00272E835B|nr:hypothetical protein [Leuconostoc carnosum]WLC97079.1 hypothetical protein Q5R05_05265 [Leuconostoc carnosum]
MNNLSIDNWISLVGISLPIIGGMLTFIVKSYSDAKKRNEELRPNVFITYKRFRKNDFFREVLVLKNYGKTTAQVKEISIQPLFHNNGNISLSDFDPNSFSSIKDLPIAPGQKIQTLIGISGANDELIIKENRHFKITYSNIFFNKTYISEYDVDETHFTVLNYLGNDDEIKVMLDKDQFSKLLAVNKDK